MSGRTTILLFVVLITSVAAFSISRKGEAGDGHSPKILKFETMLGVRGSFTGDQNPIRGIRGGGLPWVVDSAEGSLRMDGRIEVEIEGLVLDPFDPGVIDRGLAGINPSPFFKAIVSCISTDEDGEPMVVNVETGLFEATASGDSEIEDVLDLPNPCIAPIIFVTSAGGSWFSVTGF